MQAFVDSTPKEVKETLQRFGFKPEPTEIREDFTQWRKDVGKPLELYADVYKNGNLKLYSRTGLTVFPKGKRPNFITNNFEGKLIKVKASMPKQLSLLLLQVGFISSAEYIAFQAVYESGSED